MQKNLVLNYLSLFSIHTLHRNVFELASSDTNVLLDNDQIVDFFRAFKGGNKKSFDSFYNATYKSVYYKLIYFVKNSEVANDLSQDVYIEFYKNANIPNPTSGSGQFSALTGSSGTFYTTSSSVASGYTNRFGQSRATSINYYYNYATAKGSGNDASSACNWWTRSPKAGSRYAFVYLSQQGNAADVSADGSNYYTVFGFCV